ncbi:hypothetical protein GX50_08704 [[Emmonsia] crescens]|uniref:Uncharacterized protein n=1 Tax=[Emmonsia] crescens TaxID=73230 RepID=A0A2B7Z697_9EURO|nr:hypothetical protein GX50_08704 [Emmonsia crescens]
MGHWKQPELRKSGKPTSRLGIAWTVSWTGLDWEANWQEIEGKPHCKNNPTTPPLNRNTLVGEHRRLRKWGTERVDQTTVSQSPRALASKSSALRPRLMEPRGLVTRH